MVLLKKNIKNIQDTEKKNYEHLFVKNIYAFVCRL